jgi:hypothetical protein
VPHGRPRPLQPDQVGLTNQPTCTHTTRQLQQLRRLGRHETLAATSKAAYSPPSPECPRTTVTIIEDENLQHAHEARSAAQTRKAMNLNNSEINRRSTAPHHRFTAKIQVKHELKAHAAQQSEAWYACTPLNGFCYTVPHNGQLHYRPHPPQPDYRLQATRPATCTQNAPAALTKGTMNFIYKDKRGAALPHIYVSQRRSNLNTNESTAAQHSEAWRTCAPLNGSCNTVPHDSPLRYRPHPPQPS